MRLARVLALLRVATAGDSAVTGNSIVIDDTAHTGSFYGFANKALPTAAARTPHTMTRAGVWPTGHPLPLYY